MQRQSPNLFGRVVFHASVILAAMVAAQHVTDWASGPADAAASAPAAKAAAKDDRPKATCDDCKRLFRLDVADGAPVPPKRCPHCDRPFLGLVENPTTKALVATVAKPDPTGAAATIDPALNGTPFTADLSKIQDREAAKAIQETQAAAKLNRVAINFVWTLICGFLVMFMQAGFALLEAGLSRAKNVAHTLGMNFLIYALGMAGFWACGFAFMWGNYGPLPTLGGTAVLDAGLTVGDGWKILGTKGFFMGDSVYDVGVFTLFLFQMLFMHTTATVPTGAMAERWKFGGFIIFGLWVGAFLYPVYGGWVWGGGWLTQIGDKWGLGHGVCDFAGSSVVHMQGGLCALAGATLLGPRIGKYAPDGTPLPILGHHIGMVVLGSFILCFGWFGFNPGSTLAGADLRTSIVAVNTMLAGAAGAVAACIVLYYKSGKPDPTMLCNGMLAGLVAITAPCAFVGTHAAIFIGAVAGVLVVYSVFFWERNGVDDPVGAISVHGVNGLWGTLALGLFANGTYGAGWNGTHWVAKVGEGFADYSQLQKVSGEVFADLANAMPGFTEIGVTGLLYGNPGQLWAQILGSLVCITLVLGHSFLFFGACKFFNMLRVSREDELQGLDIPEMGVPGYPDFYTHVVDPNAGDRPPA